MGSRPADDDAERSVTRRLGSRGDGDRELASEAAEGPVAGVHALAYPIGARFHVPHGLSNSLVLAPVMRFNLEVAHAMYADLGQIIKPGLQGSSMEQATQLVDYLGTLAGELGLPTQLRQVGIAEKDIDQLAQDAMLQTRLLMNSPREIKLQDAAALYREAL